MSDDHFTLPSAGWRDEICGCKECRDLYYVKDLVFLKEPEELYEPPLDDEANESLEDITLRKLNSMPRDKAIEAVNAYNKIKEDLQNFLQQAAKKGKVITPEDVHEFFGVGLFAGRDGRPRRGRSLTWFPIFCRSGPRPSRRNLKTGMSFSSFSDTKIDICTYALQWNYWKEAARRR